MARTGDRKYGSIWTVGFWKAAAERAVRAFASGALAGGAAGAVDITSVPWYAALSVGAAAAVIDLLVSLSANSATGDGPGATSAETVTDDL
jgi:hypothetical protein